MHFFNSIYRRKTWLTLALLTALVLSACSSSKDPKGSQAAKATPVVIAKVTQGDMNVYLNGLGSVTALNTVTVRTRIDGQIMKIAFTEGQLVHEGDVLVEIDPRPYEVLLTQAEGQLAKDQASLQNARLDLTRFQNAAEAVTQQQVDTAAATVAQFEGTVKTDQGQLDNAKLNLVYCHITAPITGRIGLRLVDVGNMVHAADATGLIVITQLQPITVLFSLPEDNLPQVLKAMKAQSQLPVEGYDRAMKTKLSTGYLLAVDNQIDSTTGTAKFKAQFTNEDGTLFPNQFVNVRLLVDVKKDVTLMPTAAIQRSPQSAFVYVVKSDNTVEMRTITLGPSEGDQTSIEQGLAPGETVITDGVDKLLPGNAVVPRDRTAANTPSPTADSSGPDASKAPQTRHGKHKTEQTDQ
jgi:multidrug efflux system membrane fusion protein